MSGLSRKEIKEVQLNILKFVDKVCFDNGLRYYLCGGTLIGAVRHKGYIPWDDDIDINMPAGDFKKLNELLKKSKRYRLLMDEKDYYYSFGKLVDTKTVLVETTLSAKIKGMGVNIDVFPLAGLPDNNKEASVFFDKALKLRHGLALFATKGKVGSRNPVKIIKTAVRWHKYKNIGMEKIKEEIEKLTYAYDFDNSENVCSIGGAYLEKEIYPRAYFDNAIKMRFEDLDAVIPKGYDAFLTQMYGDYMQLPPKEKQVGHHKTIAYWKDGSE